MRDTGGTCYFSMGQWSLAGVPIYKYAVCSASDYPASRQIGTYYVTGCSRSTRSEEKRSYKLVWYSSRTLVVLFSRTLGTSLLGKEREKKGHTQLTTPHLSSCWVHR